MTGFSSSWRIVAILVGGQLLLASEAAASGPAVPIERDRDAAGPREIGTGKQLFLDEEMLASFDRLQFTLNPAKGAERVLAATASAHR